MMNFAVYVFEQNHFCSSCYQQHIREHETKYQKWSISSFESWARELWRMKWDFQKILLMIDISHDEWCCQVWKREEKNQWESVWNILKVQKLSEASDVNVVYLDNKTFFFLSFTLKCVFFIWIIVLFTFVIISVIFYFIIIIFLQAMLCCFLYYVMLYFF